MFMTPLDHELRHDLGDLVDATPSLRLRREILERALKDLRKRLDLWQKAASRENLAEEDWRTVHAEVRNLLSVLGYFTIIRPGYLRVGAPALVDLVVTRLAPAAKSAKQAVDAYEVVRDAGAFLGFRVLDKDVESIVKALRADGPRRAAQTLVGRMLRCPWRTIAAMCSSFRRRSMPAEPRGAQADATAKPPSFPEPPPIPTTLILQCANCSYDGPDEWSHGACPACGHKTGRFVSVPARSRQAPPRPRPRRSRKRRGRSVAARKK